MADVNTIAANDIAPWNELTTTGGRSCSPLTGPKLPPMSAFDARNGHDGADALIAGVQARAASISAVA